MRRPRDGKSYTRKKKGLRSAADSIKDYEHCGAKHSHRTLTLDDKEISTQRTAESWPFATNPLCCLETTLDSANYPQSDGESWSRQRRIIAPALNERISEVVWKESAEQASQMAALMVEEPYGESRGTIYGLRTIALNVLGRIAYGQPKPFKMSQSLRKPISEISYIDAVSICTEFLVVAALVPASLLCLEVMPNAIRTLGLAIKKLPDLTKDLLTREQQRLETGVKTPDNLVRMLISLSHDSELINGDMLPSGSLRQTLTEDELAGNMFIFTAAGFDTTANTMAYAVTLLAAYPQWQVWIQQEVDHVLEFSKAADVQYSTAFPKLTRCLALMVNPPCKREWTKSANIS